MRSQISIVIFLLPFIIDRSSADQFPYDSICSKCSCEFDSKLVQCRGGLSFVDEMPVFPAWTEILILNQNRIPFLRDNSFRGANRLRELYISDCGLERIDSRAFDGLTSLITLDLSYNRLRSWPDDTLHSLRSLRNLNISSNSIVDLSAFTQLLPSFDRVQLDRLDLAGNEFKFASTDFVRLPPVRYLDLSRSPFHAVRGRRIAIVTTTDEHRQDRSSTIAEVRVDALIQADHLNLYGCRAYLDGEFFREISHVIELNIGGRNRIDSYEVFANFERLESLNLSQSESINPSSLVENRSWSVYPPRIRSLDVSFLDLEHISLEKLSVDNRLTILHASNNRLKSIRLPAKLSNLKILRLNSNRFNEFPRIFDDERRGENSKFESSLEELDLSDNLLTKIDSDSLRIYTGLRRLYLSHNRIVTIRPTIFDECCLRSLEILDLSHNSIEIFSSVHLRELRELNLGANRLTRIGNGTFRFSTNLRRLELDYDHDLFKSTTSGDSNFFIFDELSESAWNLKYFSARGTQLESLPIVQFARLLSRLEYLDLSENRLTSEQWESVVGSAIPSSKNACLRTIRLRRNRISYLKNLTIFKNNMANRCLERLDLKENPFECDCRLEPVFAILKSLPESDGEIYNESLYYCFSPQNYYRYPMLEFASNLRPCSFYDSDDASTSMSSINSVSGGLRAIVAIFLGLVAVVLLSVFCRTCSSNAMKYGFNLRQRMYKPLRRVMVVSRSASSDRVTSSPVML